MPPLPTRSPAALLLLLVGAGTGSGGFKVLDDNAPTWADMGYCAPDTRGRSAMVEENCQEGADAAEWDINGAGDPSIQGFADKQSYRPRETVTARVKTDATAYRVDVYRVGYYRGAGARRVAADVAKLAPLPQHQPDCRLLEEESLLIDCANWAPSFAWAVPEDAASGVYFMRLTRTDRHARHAWRRDGSSVAASPKFANPEWDYRDPPPCGWPAEGAGTGGGECAETEAAYAQCEATAMKHAYGAQRWRDGTLLHTQLAAPFASHIYFVVKPVADAPPADVLFQTADTTWHAYNTYGAPNTYGVPALRHHWPYFPFGENVTAADRRSYKRSYNVPMLTRDTRAVNMLWQAEYPMIRWLERQGYSVDYISGTDTDAMPAEALARHRLFLSVGHDEYWSLKQRRHVEAARDLGLHLAFFSGNEVYWKVRWEAVRGEGRLDADADGVHGPRRVMAVYKETQAPRKIDPHHEWTGTWRDASPHNPEGGDPENSLTGTLFTVNAWRNDALVVPYPYTRLRFWRHTPLAALKSGQSAVLLKGLLGHEWDEDVDNGHRPRGLVRLSETTIHNVQYIFDAGAAFDSGTGTHHLVAYRAASGAMVLGTGTIQWMWGLDPVHDSQTGLPTDAENAYSTRIGYDVSAPEPAVQQATVNMFADMGVRPATPDPHIVLDAAAAMAAEDAQRRRHPPSCTVASAAFDAVARTWNVTGQAAVHPDTSGVIGGVEVSASGFQRWHPVGTRLARPSVEWTAAIAAPYVEGRVGAFACRATDDALYTGPVHTLAEE
eukprot:TRINITY_DN22647_c0_g1_i1.p1 TRINITY_DN22647_c0_g1~~TRINITY_DN22647_c0_g1_i1.p1  ORF type:complete len:779 (+),score=219.29 TRINITY_DN22647_c0_g1_i1:78-2414(+)